uniref:Uncharacterized protein n=1 Tax=Ditylenchus dipsaci TaxID=166011 RepID=A0A915D7Y5_9BILA
MSNHQNASIYSSIKHDSFSSLNFQRQLLQRRSAFGVSTPAAQFNQSNIYQQGSLMCGEPPKIINGLPAEQWHSMSDERRRIFMQDKRKKSAFKTEMCKGYVERVFATSVLAVVSRILSTSFAFARCIPSSSQNCAGTMPSMEAVSTVLVPSFHVFMAAAPESVQSIGVSGVPKQPSVPQFSSSDQQMPFCVVCSGKASVKVVASNPNV